MDNWFVDRDKIKKETTNAIMGELEYLLEDEADEDRTTNYWIDNTHNVFAFIFLIIAPLLIYILLSNRQPFLFRFHLNANRHKDKQMRYPHSYQFHDTYQ